MPWTLPGFGARGYGWRVTHTLWSPGLSGSQREAAHLPAPAPEPGTASPTKIFPGAHHARLPELVPTLCAACPASPGTQLTSPGTSRLGDWKASHWEQAWLWSDSAGPSCVQGRGTVRLGRVE